MARFPSERFRKALGQSRQVVAVVELVREGIVIASSEKGDMVVEEGQVTFDATRDIKSDCSITLLVPNRD